MKCAFTSLQSFVCKEKMTTRIPFRHITSLASVHRIGVFRNVLREQNWSKSGGRLASRWRNATFSSAVEVDEVVEERSEAEGAAESIKEREKVFGKLKFRSELVDALKEARISSLTEIQEKGIPAIRQEKDILIASHTGSGKTYSYLLPIVERLKADEEREEGSVVRPKRPRVMVIGPTRELTDQILLVAKSLSHHTKFCSMVLNAGVKMKVQKKNLALHQDLVVATPSKLLENYSSENIFFSDVQVLVLDEADTLFDHTFFPEIQQIITMLQKRRKSCQFILVAATIPKARSSKHPSSQSVKSKIKTLLPGLKYIQTSTLHKGVSGSVHSFIVLKPGEDKLQRLKDEVSGLKTQTSKTMIFCNTLNSCRCVEHTLEENEVSTLCYHGEIPKPERKELIEKFTSFEHEDNVLVCTDVAARGLDIPGGVDQIINFDFPLTPVDYLHRSGRTARAGASGKISSLISGKDRVLADRIKWAVEHDLPLDELTSKKHILPPSQRPNLKQPNQKKVSFKGLRGAKRVEAMKEIAQVSSEQKRRQVKRKYFDKQLRNQSKSLKKRSQ